MLSWGATQGRPVHMGRVISSAGTSTCLLIAQCAALPLELRQGLTTITRGIPLQDRELGSPSWIIRPFQAQAGQSTTTAQLPAGQSSESCRTAAVSPWASHLGSHLSLRPKPSQRTVPRPRLRVLTTPCSPACSMTTHSQPHPSRQIIDHRLQVLSLQQYRPAILQDGVRKPMKLQIWSAH